MTLYDRAGGGVVQDGHTRRSQLILSGGLVRSKDKEPEPALPGPGSLWL
jgi:hypothetical protein